MAECVQVLVSVGYADSGVYYRRSEPTWKLVSLRGGECRFMKTNSMIAAHADGVGIINAIGFHQDGDKRVSHLALDRNMAFHEEIDVDLADHSFDPTVLIGALIKV